MVLAQSPTSELSESQRAVLQKYLINGETSWEAVAQRVARFVASAEPTPELQQTWEQKFLSILLPMKFVPGGSILANSDHGTHGMLNCFVLSSEDHIHDITKLVSDSVLTTKFRGGVGINIGAEGDKGYIRPKGAPFQDGKALGPCAVLDMVSENSKKITTGNKARRGAFLFSMNWRHPDVWEFIQAKTQSTIDANLVKGIIEEMAQLTLSDEPAAEKQAKLTALQNQLGTAWVETHLNPEGKRDRRWHNANISVQLDDEFFEKLDQGDEEAQKLWHTMAQNAHDTADPGLLLIDNAKRRSPIRDFVTCTNPCVTANTWIHTGEGARQVKDLVGIQHSTYVNGELFSTTREGFWATGDKPVFRLQTQEGYHLRLTGNHRVLKVTAQTRRRQYTEWVTADALEAGDRILLHNHRQISPWQGAGTQNEGWLLGSLVGDGTFANNASGAMQGILAFWGEHHQPMLNHAVTLLNQIDCTSSFGRSYAVAGTCTQQKQKGVVSTVRLARLAQTFGIKPGHKTITTAVEQASYAFYQGFLQGLFDADGSVQGNQAKGVSLRLAQSDLPLLEAVQRMLLRMGIASTVYAQRREAQERLLPNGQGGTALYACKAQHELVIAGNNIQQFAEQIGFQDPDKAAKLNTVLATYVRTPNRERFAVTVTSLTPDGIETVYDCTVPGPACFDANGLVAHNCGEIFLPPNSACNLGSLVLTKFVHRDEQGEINVDWDDLAETVGISIRFLDNVLSVSEFATPDQKENVTNVFRQLGLGIMGWADYLKLARIPYDSQEHLEAIDHWGSWIANHAYRASETIAAEKSPCGVWSQIKDVKTGNPFEMWVDSEGNHYNGAEVLESDRQDLAQVPRRNATVLSIAPTGSIAQLAACSWAFEPDFGLTLWKQVFVDASKNEQNWVQILNPYLDELDLSDADAEIVKQTGSLAGTQYATAHPDVTGSFKIAREIPPGWHIIVQSKWQDWIDSSISKTINLPAQATVEEIKQIYRLAEKAGLKGVTIYRSGTLDSEPIKVGEAEKSEETA
ncbi:Vitamin B12-dependent ribonucleoside-diphosphatereductase [Acaryochloris thomasi RCC1774]|uniref:Vitamin B12-dependent ribonucleoside-diphosphatereductase n=1 Tax=Acaryochloris thomasi RCC1774 TaxID=1764569 RepID=A0A2W1JCH1_9CYAN|nr:LAGLIDADG family homing endonuclease [Acaryochloris thomasi]PZD71558.1 Vitamin B12-dependent ribonucleoside-diphosphatereductase [Acaryochloris thomasi RCC1774]